MELRTLVERVATTYDRNGSMDRAAQRLLRSAGREVHTTKGRDLGKYGRRVPVG